MSNNSVIAATKQRLSAVRDNKIFQFFVISIILLSSLSIGLRTYDLPNAVHLTLSWVDYGVTLFFLIEITIRILAEDKPWHFFFRRRGWGWNWFDFIIVCLSLIHLEGTDFILLGRLLRLFRVMRLISFIPQLRLLVSALLMALPRMGYVALMMFVIFYMYATLGSLLFEHINPELWGDVGIAMLTLFRVATFEDWTDVMYETMAHYPVSWIYYVSFIFLSAFVFLNMMIGIIINVLEEQHSKADSAQEQTQHQQVLESLRRLELEVRALREKN